jgi:hypothetical protein
MASNGGGSMRRFSGKGESAAADLKSFRKWFRAHTIVIRAKGTPSTAFGPLLYTLLDGIAEKAVKHLEIDDLEVAGGEDILLEILEDRFPDDEPIDRIESALDEIETLRRDSREAMADYCARARAAFSAAEAEGVPYPPDVRGHKILRGAVLSKLEKATVMSYARGLNDEDVIKALKITFPDKNVTDKHKYPAHVTSDVDVSGGQGAFHSEMIYNTGGNDANASSFNGEMPPMLDEIDALVSEYRFVDGSDCNQDILEESEAVEVLATWMQQRDNINKTRLARGFGPASPPGSTTGPANVASSSGSLTNRPTGAPRPDLNRLASRTRCFSCNEVGHFSRDCPKKGGKGKSKGRKGKFGGFVVSGASDDPTDACVVCSDGADDWNFEDSDETAWQDEIQSLMWSFWSSMFGGSAV